MSEKWSQIDSKKNGEGWRSIQKVMELIIKKSGADKGGKN